MGKKENERSKNDEVCTPPEIFELVLKALEINRFDFDPCSHPDAIVPVKQRVLLPKYGIPGVPAGFDVVSTKGPSTIVGDGLECDWYGNTWLNPPYAQLQYSVPSKKHPKGKYPWLHKLAYEAKRGVAFLPSRTSSQWWHRWVLNCARAHILVQLKGRVQHHNEEWGSPFHQVLVGYDVYGRGETKRMTLARWRTVFNHPERAFVSSLRMARECMG